MKKILFTIGLQFNEQNRTGVGEVYYNLLSAIDFDVWVISNKKTFENKMNIHCIYMSDFKYRIFRYLRYFLPITFFVRQKFDVYVSDGFIPIVPKKAKQYAFVHDLMHVIYPENYKKSVLLNYTKFYKDVVKRSVFLISVSETTKNDLIKYKHISAEKISVLPLTTTLSIDKKVSEPFFICIGAMRKNKNLLNTIKGFEDFKKNNRNSVHTLFIAGSKSGEYETLKAYVDSHSLSDCIQFLGYITDDQKIDLLSKCTALVMLSSYEGFGIPILEAGLNKIPVIASRIPAFEEFTKNNVIFAEPDNIQSISTAFETAMSENILQNKSIKFFEELHRYTPEQFKQNVYNLLYI